MKEISKICRKHGVLVHSDIAQAVGKINVDVEDLGIDLASISGHKVFFLLYMLRYMVPKV